MIKLTLMLLCMNNLDPLVLKLLKQIYFCTLFLLSYCNDNTIFYYFQIYFEVGERLELSTEVLQTTVNPIDVPTTRRMWDSNPQIFTTYLFSRQVPDPAGYPPFICREYRIRTCVALRQPI